MRRKQPILIIRFNAEYERQKAPTRKEVEKILTIGGMIPKE